MSFIPGIYSLKTDEWLNVTRGRREEWLPVNDGWLQKESVNRGALQEVEGDAIHGFANKRALEMKSLIGEIFAQFRLEGLSMGEGLGLEVNTAGAVGPVGYFPTCL